MNNHLALHTAAKHLNKRTLRYIGFAAGAVAGCAAVISFLGTMLMLRQLQLVAAQKRALPVIQRAAQLYLDQNGRGTSPPGAARPSASPAGRTAASPWR